MKKTWAFRQKDFLAAHGGTDGSAITGSCAALSARWAKMMLKARKNASLVPQLSAKERDEYFVKTGIPGKIMANQTKIDAAQTKNQHEYTTVATAHAAMKIVKRVHPEMDKLPFDIAVNNALRQINFNVNGAVILLAKAEKLTIREEAACPKGFADYFKNAEVGGCYLLLSGSLGHMMAGYVTGGYFWRDYYFFDPNSGEFVAEGDTQLAAMMDKFEKHYARQLGANGSARRMKVIYSK